MATNSKVSIKIRVVHNEKAAGNWGKLYDQSVKVQAIIDWSMEKVAAQTEGSLTFERVEACLSEEALERRGTELDLDDLADMAVSDLRDTYGRFLKVQCSSSSASWSTPTQLPSAFKRMRESQEKLQGQLHLPTSPIGDRFDYRLQRALSVQLQEKGLGFSSCEVKTSGAVLLRLLAEALQYLLPFDDAEPSPLRAEGRVHLVLPSRFKSEVRAPLAV